MLYFVLLMKSLGFIVHINKIKMYFIIIFCIIIKLPKIVENDICAVIHKHENTSCDKSVSPDNNKVFLN